jgi:hypothetical protein
MGRLAKELKANSWTSLKLTELTTIQRAVRRRNKLVHGFFIGRKLTSARGATRAAALLGRELKYFKIMNERVALLVVRALKQLGLDRSRLLRGAPASIRRAI